MCFQRTCSASTPRRGWRQPAAPGARRLSCRRSRPGSAGRRVSTAGLRTPHGSRRGSGGTWQWQPARGLERGRGERKNVLVSTRRAATTHSPRHHTHCHWRSCRLWPAAGQCGPTWTRWPELLSSRPGRVQRRWARWSGSGRSCCGVCRGRCWHRSQAASGAGETELTWFALVRGGKASFLEIVRWVALCLFGGRLASGVWLFSSSRGSPEEEPPACVSILLDLANYIL